MPFPLQYIQSTEDLKKYYTSYDHSRVALRIEVVVERASPCPILQQCQHQPGTLSQRGNHHWRRPARPQGRTHDLAHSKRPMCNEIL